MVIEDESAGSVTNGCSGEPPGVAAIIPAYQSAAYLEETIRSILAQTHPAVEICAAIDMGTTDATEAIAASFAPAVRVIRVPASRAPGVTRQAGADATGAPLLAMLDADDLWLPHRLERQVAVMQDDPSLDGVFSRVDEFLSPELTPEQRQTVRAPLSNVMGRIASTLLLKRESLAVAGGFGTEAHPAEWIKWVSDAERAGLRLEMLPEVLVRRRIHTSNLTRRYSGHFDPMLSTIRSHIAQRRAAPEAGDPGT